MTRRSATPISGALRLAYRAAGATVLAGLTVGCLQSVASAATVNDPTGRLDQAVASGASAIRVVGWAADPDNLRQPLTVRGSVDGAVVGQVVTAVARPDVVAARFTGPTPGFAMSLPAVPGSHTVCVTALNIGAGANTALRCWNVVVPVPPGAVPTAAQLAAESPFGYLDTATASGNTVTLTGWGADPDRLAQPLIITATRDGVAAAIASATVVARPDVVYARHTGPEPGTPDHDAGQRLAPGVHHRHQYRSRCQQLLGCRSVWAGPRRRPPPRSRPRARRCSGVRPGYQRHQHPAHRLGVGPRQPGDLAEGDRLPRRLHRGHRHRCRPAPGPGDQPAHRAGRRLLLLHPGRDRLAQRLRVGGQYRHRREQVPRLRGTEHAGSGHAARPGTGNLGHQRRHRHAGAELRREALRLGRCQSDRLRLLRPGAVQLPDGGSADHAPDRPGPVQRRPDDPGGTRGARGPGLLSRQHRIGVPRRHLHRAGHDGAAVDPADGVRAQPIWDSSATFGSFTHS